MHITGSNSLSLSLTEYASELTKAGERPLSGTSSTLWVRCESSAMMRLPTSDLTIPSRQEIRNALFKARVAVISYLLEPDECHPANTWLYVCSDPTYDLKKLVPPMRRNVRRGLNELSIAWLKPAEVLSHGAAAYCDTRHRVGLNDGTPVEFIRRYSVRANNRGHRYLGAWKDKELAAFLSITEVDDWVEIEGCFSRDALLSARPNDALMYTALSHYLADKGRRVIAYGVSSIQTESNEEGLHAFKTKVGFTPRAVHRAFELHPFLLPFTNEVTLWALSATLRCSPANRRLRKVVGILTQLIKQQDHLKSNRTGRTADNGLTFHDGSPGGTRQY